MTFVIAACLLYFFKKTHYSTVDTSLNPNNTLPKFVRVMTVNISILPICLLVNYMIYSYISLSPK